MRHEAISGRAALRAAFAFALAGGFSGHLTFAGPGTLVGVRPHWTGVVAGALYLVAGLAWLWLGNPDNPVLVGTWLVLVAGFGGFVPGPANPVSLARASPPARGRARPGRRWALRRCACGRSRAGRRVPALARGRDHRAVSAAGAGRWAPDRARAKAGVAPHSDRPGVDGPDPVPGRWGLPLARAEPGLERARTGSPGRDPAGDDGHVRAPRLGIAAGGHPPRR